MSRWIASLTTALACAAALHAQETTTRTKVEVKGDEAKTVTYSGCLQTSPETRSFILAKVVPVGRTTTTEVGTAGTTTTTTTTYALVPGEKVEFQQHVGHKVEVTGMMVPAGDSKTETKTKIEREDAPDITIKEKTKSDDAMAQFRVISIKQLAESCS
jgi:co-chaperonin GroES (HSP10)